MAQYAFPKSQLVERPPRGMGAGKLHGVRIPAALTQGFVVDEDKIDHSIEGQDLCRRWRALGDGGAQRSIIHKTSSCLRRLSRGPCRDGIIVRERYHATPQDPPSGRGLRISIDE